MNNLIGIKIGDRFDHTECFESCIVTNVFISPSTQERVYEINFIVDGKEAKHDCRFLCRGEDLQ